MQYIKLHQNMHVCVTLHNMSLYIIIFRYIKHYTTDDQHTQKNIYRSHYTKPNIAHPVPNQIYRSHYTKPNIFLAHITPNQIYRSHYTKPNASLTACIHQTKSIAHTTVSQIYRSHYIKPNLSLTL